MSIRMRHTRGHTNNRRSHHALEAVNAIKDTETGKLRLPHRLDETTGMYRGKQIVTPKVKKESRKVKGPDTEALAEPVHVHDHATHEHANADVKGSKGILSKLTGAARPKARSGFGGGA